MVHETRSSTSELSLRHLPGISDDSFQIPPTEGNGDLLLGEEDDFLAGADDTVSTPRKPQHHALTLEELTPQRAGPFAFPPRTPSPEPMPKSPEPTRRSSPRLRAKSPVKPAAVRTTLLKTRARTRAKIPVEEDYMMEAETSFGQARFDSLKLEFNSLLEVTQPIASGSNTLRKSLSASTSPVLAPVIQFEKPTVPRRTAAKTKSTVFSGGISKNGPSAKPKLPTSTFTRSVAASASGSGKTATAAVVIPSVVIPDETMDMDDEDTSMSSSSGVASRLVMYSQKLMSSFGTFNPTSAAATSTPARDYNSATAGNSSTSGPRSPRADELDFPRDTAPSGQNDPLWLSQKDPQPVVDGHQSPRIHSKPMIDGGVNTDSPNHVLQARLPTQLSLSEVSPRKLVKNTGSVDNKHHDGDGAVDMNGDTDEPDAMAIRLEKLGGVVVIGDEMTMDQGNLNVGPSGRGQKGKSKEREITTKSGTVRDPSSKAIVGLASKPGKKQESKDKPEGLKGKGKGVSSTTSVSTLQDSGVVLPPPSASSSSSRSTEGMTLPAPVPAAIPAVKSTASRKVRAPPRRVDHTRTRPPVDPVPGHDVVSQTKVEAVSAETEAEANSRSDTREDFESQPRPHVNIFLASPLLPTPTTSVVDSLATPASPMRPASKRIALSSNPEQDPSRQESKKTKLAFVAKKATLGLQKNTIGRDRARPVRLRARTAETTATTASSSSSHLTSGAGESRVRPTSKASVGFNFGAGPKASSDPSSTAAEVDSTAPSASKALSKPRSAVVASKKPSSMTKASAVSSHIARKGKGRDYGIGIINEGDEGQLGDKDRDEKSQAGFLHQGHDDNKGSTHFQAVLDEGKAEASAKTRKLNDGHEVAARNPQAPPTHSNPIPSLAPLSRGVASGSSNRITSATLGPRPVASSSSRSIDTSALKPVERSRAKPATIGAAQGRRLVQGGGSAINKPKMQSTSSLSAGTSKSSGLVSKPFSFTLDARMETKKHDAHDGGRASRPHNPILGVPDFKALHAAQEAESTARREQIVPVVPAAKDLSTDVRAKERVQFEAGVKERQEEMRVQLEEKRRLREVEEEAEVKELRRKAIPKAHEVPEWYADMPKRSANSNGDSTAR